MPGLRLGLLQLSAVYLAGSPAIHLGVAHRYPENVDVDPSLRRPSNGAAEVYCKVIEIRKQSRFSNSQPPKLLEKLSLGS